MLSVLDVLNRLITDGNYLQYYPDKAEVDDRIKRYGLICNNEFLFAIQLYRRKPIEKLRVAPDVKEAARLIKLFEKEYNENPTFFENQVKYREERKAEHHSKRYEKLKQTYKSIETVKYCFKCGSRKDIQLDHIKNHNSFKDKELAYNLMNCQWLCYSCNNLKGPLEADYRTEGQIEMIQTYIKSILKGRNIIT